MSVSRHRYTREFPEEAIISSIGCIVGLRCSYFGDETVASWASKWGVGSVDDAGLGVLAERWCCCQATTNHASHTRHQHQLHPPTCILPQHQTSIAPIPTAINLPIVDGQLKPQPWLPTPQQSRGVRTLRPRTTHLDNDELRR